MFTVFVMSVVHLPFYQLAMSYTHLMSHVLSQKIKHDFLLEEQYIFDTQGDAFMSYSMLVTSIKEKMKSDFLHQENCFFLARPVTPIFFGCNRSHFTFML